MSRGIGKRGRNLWSLGLCKAWKLLMSSKLAGLLDTAKSPLCISASGLLSMTMLWCLAGGMLGPRWTTAAVVDEFITPALMK